LRIMIAAKNKALGSALRTLIEFNGHNDEILVSEEPTSFFERLSKLDFGVILLDWDLFNSRTINVIRVIKNDYPQLRLICMDIHHENIRNALDASADAFFFKSDPPVELLNLIRRFRLMQ